MSKLDEKIEQHHRLIILLLCLVIAVFVLSCTFHDIIPICHYVFGCDHNLHVAT